MASGYGSDSSALLNLEQRVKSEDIQPHVKTYKAKELAQCDTGTRIEPMNKIEAHIYMVT